MGMYAGMCTDMCTILCTDMYIDDVYDHRNACSHVQLPDSIADMPAMVLHIPVCMNTSIHMSIHRSTHLSIHSYLLALPMRLS